MTVAYPDGVTRKSPRSCKDGGALIRTPARWSKTERFVWLSKVSFLARYQNYVLDHLQQLAASIEPLSEIQTSAPAQSVLSSYGKVGEGTPAWYRSAYFKSSKPDDPVTVVLPDIPPSMAAIGLLDFNQVKAHLSGWIDSGKIPTGSDIILGHDAHGTPYGYIEMTLFCAQALELGPIIQTLQLDAQAVQTIVDRASARFISRLGEAKLDPARASAVGAHLIHAANNVARLAQYGGVPSPDFWTSRLEAMCLEPSLLAQYVRTQVIHQRTLRPLGLDQLLAETIDADARVVRAMAQAGHPIGSSLHFASRHLAIDMARALVVSGADPHFQIDGKTPFDVVGAEPRGDGREELMLQMNALLQAAASNRAARDALASMDKPLTTSP